MRYGMVFCAGTGYNYGIDGGLIEKRLCAGDCYQKMQAKFRLQGKGSVPNEAFSMVKR